MYLCFDEKQKKYQLRDFKSAQNYICFTFENDVSKDTFTYIEKLKMYSDDDMFLSEYVLNEYKQIYNENELYLKDKNEVIKLEDVKANKIAESKELLSEWFEMHPYLHTDGKYYSCTEEKQSLLNSNLTSYERAKTAEIDYPLKWNASGEECTDWTYEDLVALSLSIAAYVAPRISKQQKLEILINACTAADELDSIEVNYE